MCRKVQNRQFKSLLRRVRCKLLYHIIYYLENFQDSDCYLFAPGTHNISSAPLLLATLPATKNQSDKRFRYLTASNESTVNHKKAIYYSELSNQSVSFYKIETLFDMPSLIHRLYKGVMRCKSIKY